MSSHPFLPSARVGKYEVITHIATGGMGAFTRPWTSASAGSSP